MQIERYSHSVTVSLFRGRLSLNAGYYPMWDKWQLSFHENGGRRAGDCLDITVEVGHVCLGVTIWGLGRLSRLVSWIPTRNGRGYWIRLTRQGHAKFDSRGKCRPDAIECGS